MPTFKRFEDILAWQKGRAVNKLIYEATGTGEFAKDFGLRDQIRRGERFYYGEHCRGIRPSIR